MGLGLVAGLLACCVWLVKGVIEMASAVERDGRAVVTTCGGCYADCAFAARVEDGRVVAELPVPGHPCASRALCARGRHRLGMPFDERDRIVHPMRRRADGSGFDAISWDEAFSEIAVRLGGIVDERGPRALGMTLGVPSFDRYWAHRFMHALGSPNVYGADGACEVSRLTGWEHSLGYSPASDLAHTDCIMYLGRSIVDSSTMEAVDALNDARRRGAKIIVVDMLLLKSESVTYLVAFVVCATMAVTVCLAKIVGSTLPLLAKKLGFDPAVMASPIIMTIVDFLSLLVYFAFATAILGIG